MGLGALSLWSLVALWRGLGMVARAGGDVPRLLSGVGTRLRLVLRIRRRCWLRSRLWIRIWFRSCRLAAVRPRGLVSPVVRTLWRQLPRCELQQRQQFSQRMGAAS